MTTPHRPRPLIVIGLFAVVWGGLISQLLSRLEWSAFEHQTIPAKWIDTRDPLRLTMTAGDIHLSVVPSDEFHRRHPDALAVTYSNGTPCEIVIPDGWDINFVPYSERASFADQQNADTLAHEILHCFVPAWHAGYTARAAASPK